ncbi:MAG TPA: hypothetical protein VFV46_07100 [Lacibacter sp.]|nr:hypothetical protein [Lacibacter sp.]
MLLKKYKHELLAAVLLFAVVIVTVIYGSALNNSGISIRQWSWNNLLIVLPLFPLLFLQQKASLPPLQTINEKKNGWLSTFGIGMIFGLLDVLIIKFILHPEPYTELPPFLQPFPYSTFLYTSGAIEIEVYYRMIPLTVFLLLNTILLKGRGKNVFIIVLGLLTSIIEPIQQFPDGAWWFIVYATLSGIAMNAWQFRSYLKYGFVASLAVRLGHYLIWHILLGIYVEYFELG